MNALFSKFCCFQSTCTHEALHETIFQLIKCSLIKFESAHRVIPFRVFVYRAGRSLNLPEEFQSVRHRLGQFNAEVRNKNLFSITYVGLNKSHPFRTCTQTNDSYVTSQTVKKTQLLTALVLIPLCRKYRVKTTSNWNSMSLLSNSTLWKDKTIPHLCPNC